MEDIGCYQVIARTLFLGKICDDLLDMARCDVLGRSKIGKGVQVIYHVHFQCQDVG